MSSRTFELNSNHFFRRLYSTSEPVAEAARAQSNGPCDSHKRRRRTMKFWAPRPPSKGGTTTVWSGDTHVWDHCIGAPYFLGHAGLGFRRAIPRRRGRDREAIPILTAFTFFTLGETNFPYITSKGHQGMSKDKTAVYKQPLSRFMHGPPINSSSRESPPNIFLTARKMEIAFPRLRMSRAQSHNQARAHGPPCPSIPLDPCHAQVSFSQFEVQSDFGFSMSTRTLRMRMCTRNMFLANLSRRWPLRLEPLASIRSASKSLIKIQPIDILISSASIGLHLT